MTKNKLAAQSAVILTRLVDAAEVDTIPKSQTINDPKQNMLAYWSEHDFERELYCYDPNKPVNAPKTKQNLLWRSNLLICHAMLSTQENIKKRAFKLLKYSQTEKHFSLYHTFYYQFISSYDNINNQITYTTYQEQFIETSVLSGWVKKILQENLDPNQAYCSPMPKTNGLTLYTQRHMRFLRQNKKFIIKQTLDYFTRNLNLLTYITVREYIEANIFELNLLHTELSNPEIFNELFESFFTQALNFHQTDQKVVIFLYKLKIQIAQYRQQQDVHQDSKNNTNYLTPQTIEDEINDFDNVTKTNILRHLFISLIKLNHQDLAYLAKIAFLINQQIELLLTPVDEFELQQSLQRLSNRTQTNHINDDCKESLQQQLSCNNLDFNNFFMLDEQGYTSVLTPPKISTQQIFTNHNILCPNICKFKNNTYKVLIGNVEIIFLPGNQINVVLNGKSYLYEDMPEDFRNITQQNNLFLQQNIIFIITSNKFEVIYSRDSNGTLTDSENRALCRPNQLIEKTFEYFEGINYITIARNNDNTYTIKLLRYGLEFRYNAQENTIYHTCKNIIYTVQPGSKENNCLYLYNDEGSLAYTIIPKQQFVFNASSQLTESSHKLLNLEQPTPTENWIHSSQYFIYQFNDNILQPSNTVDCLYLIYWYLGSFNFNLAIITSTTLIDKFELMGTDQEIEIINFILNTLPKCELQNNKFIPQTPKINLVKLKIIYKLAQFDLANFDFIQSKNLKQELQSTILNNMKFYLRTQHRLHLNERLTNKEQFILLHFVFMTASFYLQGQLSIIFTKLFKHYLTETGVEIPAQLYCEKTHHITSDNIYNKITPESVGLKRHANDILTPDINTPTILTTLNPRKLLAYIANQEIKQYLNRFSKMRNIASRKMVALYKLSRASIVIEQQRLPVTRKTLYEKFNDVKALPPRHNRALSISLAFTPNAATPDTKALDDNIGTSDTVIQSLGDELELGNISQTIINFESNNDFKTLSSLKTLANNTTPEQLDNISNQLTIQKSELELTAIVTSIETLANEKINYLDIKSGTVSNLDIEQLISCYLTNTFPAYLNLETADIDTLNRQINDFLDQTSRLQQIERCIGILSDIQATTDQTTKRNYIFKLYKSLFRKNLASSRTEKVLQYRSNLLLWPNQLEIIRDTRQLIDYGLTMGQGKSKVIIPLLAYNLKSSGVIVEFPSELFDTCFFDLKATLQNNFGISPIALNFERARDIKSLYNTLTRILIAFKDQQPIITTGKSLSSL
jgi:hypothetical protein